MVKICTDSCCDLNKTQIEENEIGIIPLIVVLGEEEYIDGVNVAPKDIFDFVAKTKVLPKTSARSTEDYKEFFAKMLENGDEVVFTGISSQLSSSYENACRAKEELGSDKLFIVDSKSLSTGIGLLVLYACCLAKEGKSGSEIAKLLTSQVERNQASFVVDKLDYLYKGGRCSAMAKFGANLLRIKPCLELKQGKIENTSKFMGPFKGVVKKYIDKMLSDYPNPRKEICFITHTCTGEMLEFVDSMVEYVKSKNIFKEVVATVAGATITSHCGENTLGILYLLEE